MRDDGTQVRGRLNGCDELVRNTSPRAFTLVELLIVIAIITILALIAIPNFLEAQVRAKVSRSVADMRTIATAIEAYCVDYQTYPLDDGQYNTIPASVTTPVAYLTSNALVDPFADRLYHKGLLPGDPEHGEAMRWYSYFRIVPLSALGSLPPDRMPAKESVDGPGYNMGAFGKYGMWRLVGRGPDLWYNAYEHYTQTGDTSLWAKHLSDRPVYGGDIPYDPSNGSMSWGNVLRTQKSVNGGAS